MKLKIALCLAASICMSSGLTTISANAQGNSLPPAANGPSGPMPQQAPDIGDRSGKWKRLDGQGGGRMRERMMERFDANHDGNLDDSEKAAMRAAREQRMQKRGMGGGRGIMPNSGGFVPPGAPAGTAPAIGEPGPGLGQPPGGGSGQGFGGGQGMGRGMGMNDEQRQARRQKMLERFDANHDGKLDDAEKSQMRSQFGNRGFGGGGGGHRRRGNWGGAGDQNTPMPNPSGVLPEGKPIN